ncbi:MAG: AAA family ATPase [Bacteroidales bacterium]|nr:AAA family ATPase [Bacteroidales bacterium]MDE7465454.1 ATP-binding protein [Muribaculaceae bacterium]
MGKVNVKYPIGQQSFEVLRRNDYLYVDKTHYIEKIINGGQYYFLGRPRRFGKSLFLSTLKAFYEGKRELFEGLYADTMDWDWEPYPVLYLDLNTGRYKEDGELYAVMEHHLRKWEEEYNVDVKDTVYSLRFSKLIEIIAEKTGKGVVILVDEYDKPLVNNIHDRKKFEEYRGALASLYSNFKSGADYIKLVFLTGVSRFGKLSVFSGLNNIRDISFVQDFSAICGITEEELKADFKPGITALAEEYERTEEEEISELKRWYDGYHFSKKSPDIYNPFSLLQVFASRDYSNYWIASGNSSLLAEQLKRTDSDLNSVLNAVCGQTALEGLDIDSISPLALLYQTGYITIKQYDREDNIYTLGIPNLEVKEGFYEQLLPYYTSLTKDNTHVFVVHLRKEMQRGEVDTFMKRLQSLFAGFGHDLKFDEERNVQNAMLLIFSLVGINVEAEFKTSDGRIDILVRTADYIYIMELKYNHSAEEALSQIIEKEYSLPWSIDSRKTIAVGINYSTEKRRIEEWKYKIL